MATKEQLKAWVDYANENKAVILYDSAYEAFITQDDVPHTIYEIEGARTCAIEFRSFSKTAGFTGNRCAYTVVPMELERDGAKLNALWNRRQCTKFNGVPYVIQRGAAAVYTEEGQRQIKETTRLLSGERPGHPGGPDRCRSHLLWRRERPLHLAQDPRRHGLLGVLR